MKRLIGLLVVAALAGCGGDPSGDPPPSGTPAIDAMCAGSPTPDLCPDVISYVEWCKPERYPPPVPGMYYSDAPAFQKCGLWYGVCGVDVSLVPVPPTPTNCRTTDHRTPDPAAPTNVLCVASCDFPR